MFGAEKSKKVVLNIFMKKVCVSTYCEWSSYGSVLQTIGLKRMLNKLNSQSFVVKDVPAPATTKIFCFSFSKNIKILLKNILNLRIKKKRELCYRNCVEFINKHVDVKYYNDFETLKKQPPKADYYIAGSDQIWHPSLCKPIFFLDFLPETVKRYSYASSMGVTEVKKDKEEEFKNLIRKFDTFSVREDQMVEIIDKYVQAPITVHIDPTFLVSSKEWEEYEKTYNIKQPYILVYAIYWNKKLNKELKKLHKKSGIKVVAICTKSNSIWSNEKLYDVDCGNFLYLIHHAKAVISSSFHGVSLALNYNKKVAAVINPSAPSRLDNLLNVLKVENTSISDVMDFNDSQYEQINLRIKQEKDKSINYLKGILMNEK